MVGVHGGEWLLVGPGGRRRFTREHGAVRDRGCNTRLGRLLYERTSFSRCCLGSPLGFGVARDSKNVFLGIGRARTRRCEGRLLIERSSFNRRWDLEPVGTQ